MKHPTHRLHSGFNSWISLQLEKEKEEREEWTNGLELDAAQKATRETGQISM